MAEPGRAGRRRSPLLATFRDSFVGKDAKVRIDERDETGARIIAGRRSSGHTAISEAELQRNVSQDLEILMNTVNLAATLDLHDHPHARRSILNHGFPDLMHRTIDEAGVADVGREIESALTIFEPRLAPSSVEVRRVDSLDPFDLKLRFLVRAELRYDPLNLPVEFVADLERDTGKISIRRA